MSGSYSPLAALYPQAQAQSNQAGMGLVPTISYSVDNILGTPVPQVGNQQPAPNYAAGMPSNINPMHTLGFALALIIIGYVAFHALFEK